MGSEMCIRDSVMGKGTPAALIAAGVRAALRGTEAAAAAGVDLGVTVTRTARTLADDMERTESFVTLFEAVIDLDDAPRTLPYQGLRSRLRADAANRELAAIPEARRHDALRAVYGAVNDMLDADATDRSLTVGDVDVTVLIVDD